MIETELKRMFPGIQFHHISTDRVKDRDESVLFRTDLHNAAENNYAQSLEILRAHKETREQRTLVEEATGMPMKGVHKSDVDSMQNSTRRAFKVVLDTNSNLPRDLRAKHSKKR